MTTTAIYQLNVDNITQLFQTVFEADPDSLVVYCYDYQKPFYNQLQEPLPWPQLLRSFLNYVQQNTSNLISTMAWIKSHEPRHYAMHQPYQTIPLNGRMELVTQLLQCPAMRDNSKRKTIVAYLPPDILFDRSENPQIEVMRLVEACINYPDGLQTLHKVLKFVEGNSYPMQAVTRLMDQDYGI